MSNSKQTDHTALRMSVYGSVSLIECLLIHDQVQLTFRYYRKVGHLGHWGGHFGVVKTGPGR
jgi:hypothetical protein